jgi:hypothetical protein
MEHPQETPWSGGTGGDSVLTGLLKAMNCDIRSDRIAHRHSPKGVPWIVRIHGKDRRTGRAFCARNLVAGKAAHPHDVSASAATTSHIGKKGV